MKRLVSLFILSAIAITLSAQKIIQWRGENRTGIYNETGLLKKWPADGPEMLWAVEGLDQGHSSVAIASEKLYITGMTESTGYVHVFDLDGKPLAKKGYGPEWSVNYEGPRGTITVNDGKLYLASGSGGFICLDQNTLDIVWEKNLERDFKAKNIVWGINESPLIVDEKVILTPGGPKFNIVALNKNDGKLIWSCPGEGDLSAYCSPLFIGDQQIPQVVVMTANHIIGVDVATGKKLWSYEHKNRHSVHANTPIYSDNMIFCTSGYGKGSVMLRLTDGGRSVEKVWESQLADSRIGAMVKVGDYLYGSGDTNKFWFCIDWKTGQIKYQSKALAIGVTIAADGMLYCYTQKGEMALATTDPDQFNVVSKFSITLGTGEHWAHPVIYNGVLYIRHGDALMAYKIK